MINIATNLLVYLLLVFGDSHGEEKNFIVEILHTLENLEKKVADQAETIKLQSSEIASLKQIQSLENPRTSTEGTWAYGRGKSRRFVLENEGPVVFTAAITPRNVPHLKHMDTIKFETIITSIGGGYNNLSGVFVVPVSGIYAFSCSLLDDAGDNGTYHGTKLHAEIVHDHRILGRIFAHAETRADANYRDQGAQTVFTKANQGDQVWIRVVDNNDLGLGGELYSTFSGCLLQAV